MNEKNSFIAAYNSERVENESSEFFFHCASKRAPILTSISICVKQNKTSIPCFIQRKYFSIKYFDILHLILTAVVQRSWLTSQKTS